MENKSSQNVRRDEGIHYGLEGRSELRHEGGMEQVMSRRRSGRRNEKQKQKHGGDREGEGLLRVVGEAVQRFMPCSR